jgi:CRISPR-associated protein Csm3
MAYRFRAHVVITGQITCLSGLHIGGTEENYEIGNLENPIIRDKMTGYPYIPGSSLKGKMRSLMEWTLGKVESDGRVHGRSCRDSTCQVCRIFGSSTDRWSREKQAIGPTRLLVRDAFPSQSTLEQFIHGGSFVTEAKTETSLNRITSEANPRPMERVPKGAQFDFEMVYGIYDLEDAGSIDIDNLHQVYTALELLEASVLGGGGSRGSGNILIENLAATIKTCDDYEAKASGQEIQWAIVKGLNVADVIATVQEKLGVAQQTGGQAE